MNQLISVIQGDRSPGLYRVEQPLALDEVATLCQEHNTQLFYLDGSTISNKAEFLQACAKAMNFPDYFGDNWDAFEDMLTDLEWVSENRYLVLYTQPERFAQGDADEWTTAIDILQSAVEYWEETETPLYILLNTNSASIGELPSL